MPPLQNPIRYGSMCSGMGTDSWAAISAHPDRPCVHSFAVEKDNHCRTWLACHFPHTEIFSDLHGDEFKSAAPLLTVDVLTAGFPCQPFSLNGKGLGLLDPKFRGLAILPIIQYIRETQPRIVVLENVAGLLTSHQETLVAILEALRGITDNTSGSRCYYVSFKKVSTTDFGIPQSRDRVYIIAIKYSGRVRLDFTWPTGNASAVTSWKEIFDADRVALQTYSNYKVPKGRLIGQHVRDALKIVKDRAQAKECRPEDIVAIIDTAGSSRSVGIDRCPCLTRSHCKSESFFSLQHNDMLRTTELLRLQGFTDRDINSMQLDCVAVCQLRAMIGNAFNKHVLAEILKACVHAAEAAA